MIDKEIKEKCCESESTKETQAPLDLGLSSKPIQWHVTTLVKERQAKWPYAVIKINANNKIPAVLTHQDRLCLKLEKCLYFSA